VLEGWAYTQQSLATNGADGKIYRIQPSPWADRVRLSTEILAAPTQELLTQAQQQYGARWIYADASEGPVSAQLDELTVLRYRSGDVKIYEIGAR
jgi:hypothetical protein